ncbi:MAG: ferritin-like domain-containing protein [Gemmataceae bacterium]
MKMKSLQDLYIDCLRDLHSAEAQLVKALPKMAKAASSPDLQQAFTDHLEETRGHVERLDQIFKKLGKRGTGKKCAAMEGLIEEGKELLEVEAEPDVLDAGLIGAAQKVEHYEMAAYGTARTWARQLGDHEAADLLQQTLDEEGAADKKLTELAESGVNMEAAMAQIPH